MTTVLLVLAAAMTRAAWWVYIGSDVRDPHVTGWQAGVSHDVAWLAGVGAAASLARLFISRRVARQVADGVVVLIAGLLAVTAAFGGRAEVMYGTYDRTLAGAKAAAGLAAAAALVGLATLRADRRTSSGRIERSRSAAAADGPAPS